jgi:hypothetical protein
MITNPVTVHKPARWRLRAVVLAAAAMAALGMTTIPATASAVPAAAVLSGGPTLHEQQDLSQNVTIATNNVHTILVTSPVLAQHNYLVNLAIGINNIPPGAVVLCGETTSTNTDAVYSNYGQVENEGTTASSGNCAVTGTVTINNSNDHIIAWATVYSGPGGATAGNWSMNELPVGSAVITH